MGIDASRSAAIRTAADEWSHEYGLVLAAALSRRAKEAKGAISNSYQLMAGLPGTRGPADVESFTLVLNQLEETLGAFVSRTFPPGAAADWHGLSIAFVNDARGKTSMCQVDGSESPELSAEVSQLDWPADTSYMFKQFYLAIPARGT